MALPSFKLAEINPFVERFKIDLSQRIQTAISEFTANGLGQSGALCEEKKKIFLDLLNNLIDDIKKIIFSNILNRKLQKPDEFAQIESDIRILINPLIEDFKIQLEHCYKSLGNPNAINSLLATFTNELNTMLSQLFVSYQLEFDGLRIGT